MSSYHYVWDKGGSKIIWHLWWKVYVELGRNNYWPNFRQYGISAPACSQIHLIDDYLQMGTTINLSIQSSGRVSKWNIFKWNITGAYMLWIFICCSLLTRLVSMRVRHPRSTSRCQQVHRLGRWVLQLQHTVDHTCQWCLTRLILRCSIHTFSRYVWFVGVNWDAHHCMLRSFREFPTYFDVKQCCEFSVDFLFFKRAMFKYEKEIDIQVLWNSCRL